MAFVCDLVRDRETYKANSEQTVMDVVRMMVDHNVGAIGVVSGAELVGLFSERDLMKRVVAEKRDPERTRIAEVMTRNLLTVAPQQTLEECMELLKQHGFRHLPVCKDNRLVGLISMRDLMEYAVVEKDGEVQMMRAYISNAS